MWDRIRWRINRLMSMSPQEIPHRIQERWRMGRDASFHASPLPAMFEHRPLPKWPVDLTIDASSEILRGADEILSDRLYLLGTHWPREKHWAWGWDPPTDSMWPMKWAHDIDFRHSANGRDIKFAWELLKLQHIQVLSWSSLAGHDTAKDYAIAGLNSWLDWHRPFWGIGYASGIECACRIFSLVWSAQALSPIPVSLHRRIWSALHQHASWLRRYPSLHSSANNHRVAEVAALLLLERLTPELPEADPDGREVEFLSLIESLFYDDGVCVEQSIYYQALVMEWMLYIQHICPNIRQDLQAYLARGAQFLSSLFDEEGHYPDIGDGDCSVVLRSQMANENLPMSVCGAAAILTGHSECIPTAYRADLRLSLLGLSMPQSTLQVSSRCFRQGGYSVLQHGSTKVVFDSGPLGYPATGGHGHADALSVWMHDGGQPIWIDWGTYRYNGLENRRAEARSTASHNTVTIDGRDQSVMSGAFNWGRRARATLVFADLDQQIACGEHDGYEWMHRRTVQVREEMIEIQDQLSQKPKGVIRVHFLLASGFAADECDGGWRIFWNGEEVAQFLLQNPHFFPKCKQEVHSGKEYNRLHKTLALYWEGREMQSWKIQWIWKAKPWRTR
ncbi:MAG: heparinase II/III-family protein [Myxococcota bacterium]|nr:heparinase II/III-family protein [Myxococcota bacterium]